MTRKISAEDIKFFQSIGEKDGVPYKRMVTYDLPTTGPVDDFIEYFTQLKEDGYDSVFYEGEYDPYDHTIVDVRGEASGLKELTLEETERYEEIKRRKLRLEAEEKEAFEIKKEQEQQLLFHQLKAKYEGS